jgi:hypothetical protein
MLEHEHGDHPDYQFPVKVESPQGMQVHALLYTDGYVALTIFESSYALWNIRTGKLVEGSLWKDEEWRLTSVECTGERVSKKRYQLPWE